MRQNADENVDRPASRASPPHTPIASPCNDLLMAMSNSPGAAGDYDYHEDDEEDGDYDDDYDGSDDRERKPEEG